MTRKTSPRRRKPGLARWAAIIPLLLSACLAKPSRQVPPAEFVERVCREEYGFEVKARLVGKTLYVYCTPDDLVSQDLSLRKETIDKLQDAMITSTRAVLSADAAVDFIVVRARDSRLGVVINLLRYYQDVRRLIYYRITRTDAEAGMVFETEYSAAPEDPAQWHDIPMTEFIARLAASRLQRQVTNNPLVNVLLQVQKVEGSFADGRLVLALEKSGGEGAGKSDALAAEVLREPAEETVADVLAKYDAGGVVKKILLKESGGRELLSLDARELIEKRRNTPSKSPSF